MIHLGIGPEPVRLICLGAHPDDIEIGAGGTLLRLIADGAVSSVRWAVLSATPERADEARTAADRFLEGVREQHVTVHGYRDGHFPDSWGDIKDAVEAIAADAPADVVLVPRRDDWHQDHRLLGELAWTVFRDHLILEYEIPKWDGDLTTPNVYVELPSRLVQRKAQLILECFPSQANRDWFAAETFEALARVRGIEARAAEGFAEGFHARKVLI